MTAITEPARAKVNLTLRIAGRRPDGYHEVVSLVAFAATIADRVTLTPGNKRSIAVSGAFADAIAGENLLTAALRALEAAAPGASLGAVALEKNIPVGAGLGGGSADAAALLRAVRRANPALHETVDWPGIAARLGADVPVCLAGRAAVVTGIGEQILPVPRLPPLAAVLVNAMAPVPADKTAQVFRRLAAPAMPEGYRPGDAASALTASANDTETLIGHLRHSANDLLPAARALIPEIDMVLAALEGTPGCLLARMSGAGPTCFGLYASPPAAAEAAAVLAQRHPGWWVRDTALG